jgi:hypothetical protein
MFVFVVKFDEDVNFMSSEKEEKDLKQEKRENETNVPIKLFSFPKQEHYYMEIVCIAILFLYLINYIWGRIQNSNLLNQWAKSHFDVFSSQFSNIRGYANSSNKNELQLLAESVTEYYLYCSGRKNIDGGCIVTINLKMRHDLFWLILAFISSEFQKKDSVTIDITLETLEPCVFALVPKHLATNYQTEHKDISIYASKYLISEDSSIFPSGKVLFTDCEELKDLKNKTLFNIMTYLKNYEDLLETIHFSYDYNTLCPHHDKNLRVVLKIPHNENDMNRLADLTSYIFNMVDSLTTLKLNNKTREKNLAIRRRVKEVESTAERLRQEKLQKLPNGQEEKAAKSRKAGKS